MTIKFNKFLQLLKDVYYKGSDINTDACTVEVFCHYDKPALFKSYANTDGLFVKTTLEIHLSKNDRLANIPDLENAILNLEGFTIVKKSVPCSIARSITGTKKVTQRFFLTGDAIKTIKYDNMSSLIIEIKCYSITKRK